MHCSKILNIYFESSASLYKKMLRQQVLSCFKNLHKTRKQVFKNDDIALKEARKRINEEFKTHKNEEKVEKVQELLKIGNDSEFLLRTTVVQAKLTPKGNYETKLTKDTEFFDNVPFKDG